MPWVPHCVLRLKTSNAALTSLNYIGPPKLPCSCQVCPLPDRKDSPTCLPHQPDQPHSTILNREASVPCLPAKLFNKPITSPCSQGVHHPVTTKPAAHCPCWFTLFPRATPSGPAWRAVSSPLGCEYIRLMTTVSLICPVLVSHY